MPKKSVFKDRLASSIKEETKVIDKRFEIADTIFSKKNAAIEAPKKPAPLPETLSKPIPEKVAEEGRVRNMSFNLPEHVAHQIEEIIVRAAREGFILNKGTVIRGALATLSALPAEVFIEEVKKMEKLKPGRKSS